MNQTWQKACDCKGATAKTDMRTAGLVCGSCMRLALERADFGSVADVDFNFEAIPIPPPHIP